MLFRLQQLGAFFFGLSMSQHRAQGKEEVNKFFHGLTFVYPNLLNLKVNED
jgi:hypothetical protein